MIFSFCIIGSLDQLQRCDGRRRVRDRFGRGFGLADFIIDFFRRSSRNLGRPGEHSFHQLGYSARLDILIVRSRRVCRRSFQIRESLSGPAHLFFRRKQFCRSVDFDQSMV